MKTLVVTEKKSVADDFARVLGGFSKTEACYERDDFVIAWASGHLLELQGPSEYDKKYKRWALSDLPIIPDHFQHIPRSDNKRTEDLLKSLVMLMQRKDVDTIVNACDAGREGELIFNLIADHAGVSGSKKEVQRLWLQSMTSNAIKTGFGDLRPAKEFQNLRDAAFARDEADWMVGMNGTRAFTRKFMGRARQFFAVGRVKTPTLAFLVDREREVDKFVPVPYFQVDAVFNGGHGPYSGRWSGTEKGKKTDRLAEEARAAEIVKRVTGQSGVATDQLTKRKETPPLLFDLTSIQREASSRFGYTLDRTLSLCQSLYEARKAITYPRTSSRYLPKDYAAEVPKLIESLRTGITAPIAKAALAQVGGDVSKLVPVKFDRVFNDKKVSDHFALIPTGEVPSTLKDDEAKIYDLIIRRFLAVFLPHSEWETITRETVVANEAFVTRQRRLSTPGWRAVEPQPDHEDLPTIDASGAVTTESVELLSKETQPPARFTDGSLVKAMETAGKDLDYPDDGEEHESLDDETLEELKEKGIGTPATRASIVKDLITKRLSRRSGRNILPTPLGCNLVRLVRNLDLDVLAKPDLTGNWEYRLAQMAEGRYARAEWDVAIREQVRGIIEAIKEQDGGSEEVFRREHVRLYGKDADTLFLCPACGAQLVEKTFSYMCSKNDPKDDTSCDFNLSKDQKGKYIFPETMVRLLKGEVIGPMSGFDGTRAPGTLKLTPDHQIEVTLIPTGDDDEEEEGDDRRQEEIPDGFEAGKCPKCGNKVFREGRGYKCEKNIPRKKDKECDFRIAERIKYRYLPLEQIQRLLSGQRTDELFGFVSMRGRKFKAKLYYEDGELKWEFPPRAEKKKTAKKASKKTSKKATKKKTSKKTAKTTADEDEDSDD